jgi:aryl-alcohol dehydrogenase-like predicted oxidoreductase
MDAPSNPCPGSLRRRFGATDLDVSAVGFGGWAIGGPATAGGIEIGWGDSDDSTSMAALAHAADVGITFFDTADFYGFGRSEELMGRVLANRADLTIATKVGQRLGPDGAVQHDYSRTHIVAACEASLRRLRREAIDFYQLHTARLPHFEQWECFEAMERLRSQGKVRYWGVSLATFAPGPEAEFLLERRLGHGVQLALNIVNQRAVCLLARLHAAGFGVIARMPYQFGLLTGRVTRDSRFGPRDHRSFRLRPALLERALPVLEGHVWPLAARLGVSKEALALGFCTSFPAVSTVIPGIRTAAQADASLAASTPIPLRVRDELRRLLDDGPVAELMRAVEAQG